MPTLDRMTRVNRRMMRSRAFVAMLMDIVHEYMKRHDRNERDQRDVERDVYEKLMETCEQHGIELISDEDRELVGLPPRGPDGWTDEEIIALERVRLELMLRPVVASVLVPDIGLSLIPGDITKEKPR